MEGRRAGRRFNVVRLCAVGVAAGFVLALVTPLQARAAAPGRLTDCLLGLVCTTPFATPTLALLATPTPTPTPTPTSLTGTVTSTVETTTGTVTNTVNGTVSTVNGLLGSAPTLTPTPCVLNCTSSPTPCLVNCTSSSTGSPGSGSAPGSGTPGGTTGSNGGSATSGSGSSGTTSGTGHGRVTLHGQLAAQSLDLASPPSFLGFGPIPGIDFGNAPFLWPIFLALDFAAFGAVVYVIRKRGFVAKE